jgi:peptidoglycan/LPS O-acetylase OafA/YrhL
MPDLPQKVAAALLFAIGIATLAGLVLASTPDATVAAQHQRTMLALLGVALAVAPWVRSLQLPVVGAGVLSKVAFLAVVDPGGTPLFWLEAAQVLALLAAGAILVSDARREARWNGMRAVRQGG